MARGVNKVILMGNVGGDPEIRTMQSGALVATISLATNESWVDRQTGAKQEKTEWHRVVFFAKLAEVIQNYVKKGTQLYVEGKLRTQKWQDQQGNNRYTTEILANEMQFIGNKNDSQNSNYQPNYDNEFQTAQTSVTQPAYANNQQAGNAAFAQNNQQINQSQPKAQEFNSEGFETYDDEIPF